MAQATRSCLEALPVEIKMLIMCSISDISALKALIHASPDYHHVYLRARKNVLHHVLVLATQSQGVSIFESCVSDILLYLYRLSKFYDNSFRCCPRQLSQIVSNIKMRADCGTNIAPDSPLFIQGRHLLCSLQRIYAGTTW